MGERLVPTAPITRRSVLAALPCLCCSPASASARRAGVEEVAPGVFVRRGLDAEARADNDDAIANAGFIVGGRSVLVTDPGGSLADGAWLRAEIERRTRKPIGHVVLNHVHPDHVFGAGAFVADAPVFIGHRALRAAQATRGEYDRARLAASLGAARVGPVVAPTMEVVETAEIDLGGRVVRLTAHAKAHTTSDLSLLDTATGLLFPADLLFVGRVPALDGSLPGWLAEIARLRALASARAVPGHGPTLVDTGPAFDALARYLSALADGVRAAIAAGVPLERATATVARAERGRWTLFDDYHARNVTQAYKELEWE